MLYGINYSSTDETMKIEFYLAEKSWVKIQALSNKYLV